MTNRRKLHWRCWSTALSTSKIFRTDLGDDESGFEWDGGSISGCKDGRGDDDVDIFLPETGQVQVAYRQASPGC